MKNVLFLFVFIIALNQPLKAVEYGMASIFSDQFHGKKTASGELYDYNKFTCAHKSLPFGAKIRITRLDNKQSVVVRVNDRGPYTKGRVVDLSRKAARELGLTEGEAKVRIDVVSTKDDDERPKPPPPVVEIPEKINVTKKPSVIVAKGDKKKPIEVVKPKEMEAPTKKIVVKEEENTSEEKVRPGELLKIQVGKPEREGFGVQIAALDNYDGAIKKIGDLQEEFYKNVLLFNDKSSGKSIYKIIIGPFPDITTAETYKKTAKKKKLNGFIINLKTMEKP